MPCDLHKERGLYKLPGEVVAGNSQGQVGRGSEQPDLVEGVHAHCRGVEQGHL